MSCAMRKTGISVGLVGMIVALFLLVVVPAYAADCPQPGDMIEATIDVRPGSYPNPINLGSQGVVPVALLGNAVFDVATVDMSTVLFHPMGRCEQAAAPQRYALTDVNSDGYPDLIFHFVTQEVGFQPGDTAACLHGTLFTGEHFCGHDAISIVPGGGA